MSESAADIPALLARLRDQNDAAAQQLGLQLGNANTQSPAAALHLIAALDNPERKVRWAAAVALGFISGWPSARALINTALRDGAIEVRARAQEALRTHHEPGVREMLLAALADESAAV
ncbi:MAG: HEAT repeat domain-containing protein, partial [Gemmatimonadaceae bacterium]|nr:HEAT repeat domain-containing protein [Gloeobacterales cyanobacterium ES-bin-141]